MRRWRARLRDTWRLLRRLAPYLRAQRRNVGLASAFMVGAIVASIAAPWPVQMVVDGVLLGRTGDGMLGWLAAWLPADRTRLLVVCVAAVVALAGLQGSCAYGQRLYAATAGHRVVAELRAAMFAKLQRLSLTFHQQQRSGDLLVRLTGDVSMLREVLVPAVLDSCARLLVLCATLGLMAWLDASLTLVALALVPLLGATTVRFGRRIRQVARKQRRKEGKIATVAGEALASVAVVQAYSREGEVAALFARQNRRSLRAGLKTLRLAESMARVVELTLASGTALALWLGARRVLAAKLSPGELIVFLAYLRELYKPIQGLVRTWARASKAVACGERMLEVLDSPEEVREAPDALEAPAFAGEIAFEHVGFAYTPERPVLRDVSFRIEPGELVGLVGPSGAGKSTVLALLLRLYEPQRGRILVDGRDIRSFRLDSYRRQIAVVLQEPFLFGATVEENVRHGKPEASPAEILASLEAAGAREFVEQLPHGVATVLGERGTSLSRGQQQRVALARALVRGAPILVFDEPTTGLDARTARGVRDTLARVARGRTCLWIAHDLNQILGCTRVLVLRDGRVAQEGSPERLLQRDGAFRELFEGVS